jgi:hypothetical protein
MRRMIAPGVWKDEGHGSAVATNGHSRIEGGRPVGQMQPEMTQQLSNVSRTWTGVKAKRKAAKEADAARD